MVWWGSSLLLPFSLFLFLFVITFKHIFWVAFGCMKGKSAPSKKQWRKWQEIQKLDQWCFSHPFRMLVRNLSKPISGKCIRLGPPHLSTASSSLNSSGMEESWARWSSSILTWTLSSEFAKLDDLSTQQWPKRKPTFCSEWTRCIQVPFSVSCSISALQRQLCACVWMSRWGCCSTSQDGV